MYVQFTPCVYWEYYTNFCKTQTHTWPINRNEAGLFEGSFCARVCITASGNLSTNVNFRFTVFKLQLKVINKNVCYVHCISKSNKLKLQFH